MNTVPQLQLHVDPTQRTGHRHPLLFTAGELVGPAQGMGRSSTGLASVRSATKVGSRASAAAEVSASTSHHSS